MFRFLKGLRKGGEPRAGLRMEDLPGWIEGEDSRVRADLAELVADRRPGVLEARGRMEEVLSGFDTASREGVSHKKLAGVTERSLPLFLRAMRMSLSRDLPSDPEGFYTAAGDILKGCLSAFRGQGRYLASVFPDEMKVLRDGVDDIGRGVNAMTPEIARARERLRGLAGLRGSLDAYLDAERRAAMAREGIHSLVEEESRSRRSRDAATRALAELEKGEEYRTCEGEISRIHALEEDRDESKRIFHAAASTAIHLLRKGEKIASRRRDREAVRFLREAAEMLEGGLPLPEEAASRALPLGQKALAAMVASGVLTPKNREEIDLIEMPHQFLMRITELSRRYLEISGEMDSAREALRARPVFTKRIALMREVEELERNITRTVERLEQARREGTDLEKRLQASLGEVRRRAEALSGRPFQAAEQDEKAVEAGQPEK